MAELSDEEILHILQDSEDFVENELSSPRRQCWEAYNGKVRAVPKKNRSSIVKTEVRDTVEMLMPPLMLAYLSSDYIAEFFAGKSDPPQMHELASQMTEYVSNIFFNDNPGWEILHDTTKDAMIARSVFLKTYVEEVEDIYETDLPEDEVEQDQLRAGGYEVDTETKVARRKKTEKKIRIEVIPPEQGLIDRNAKCSETALLVGQRSPLRRIDLLSMGFDKKDVDALSVESLDDPQQEEVARTGYNQDTSESSSVTHMLDRVVLREYVIKVGDERIKVFSTKDKVLKKEKIRPHENPYVVFSAIRIPHTAVGRSPAESIIPLQEFGTVLFRQVFDNLYWTNSPALAVIRNSVNPFQVQNWSFGSVFDVKVPQAITPITIPFVADKTVPFLDWLEKQREQRSGVYKDALGLDPQKLQGQTATAVSGSMTAAQRQVEIYARNICEFGFAPLFKKIWCILNGKPPPFSVRTKVGLGAGTREDRFRQLVAIADRQEKIIGTMGPGNPLIGVEQYGNSIREMVKLSSYYGPDQFINPPEIIQQKMIELQQKPPPPDPEMMKAQAEMQAKQQDAQIKQQEAQMSMAVEQQKMKLKMAEMQMTMQMKQKEAENEIMIERMKAQAEIEIEQMKAQAEMERKQQELELQTHLEAAKMEAQTRDGQGNINTSGSD